MQIKYYCHKGTETLRSTKKICFVNLCAFVSSWQWFRFLGAHNVFLPAVVVFVFCSCSKPQETVPAHLLTPDSMVYILVDIHLVEAAANVTRFNDVQSFKAQELYPAVFKSHQTDSAAFHSSFNYYLKHPKKLEAIYEKVLDELSKRESESGKQ